MPDKKLRGKELLAFLRSGNIVEERMIGATQIVFYDTCYRDLTPEQIQRQRKRIEDAALNCVMSWMAKGDVQDVE